MPHRKTNGSAVATFGESTAAALDGGKSPVVAGPRCVPKRACYERVRRRLHWLRVGHALSRAAGFTMTAKGPLAHTTLRDGRYVVLRQLGAGSQGSTWEAVDKREGRTVAIKRFDARGARSWKDIELAEREARVLAGLSHPKLPRYVEHFEEEGALYLVMEKIEGTPLSVLRKQGPADEAQVLRLLRDADDVLTYLHSRVPLVIHRDLKPSNVIRRPDGSFAFVDFGAVRDRLRPEGGSTVVGTFGYMAPEQMQGRAGPGTDVYAMGATALAFLTGAEPETLPHRGLAIDVDAVVGTRRGRLLREALKAMLQPDPDRRATRIGALLGAGRASGEEGASDRTARFDQEATRREHRHDRRAERRAQRADARRARRMSGHFAPEFGRSRWRPPFAIRFALAIAQLIVAIALCAAVPSLLLLLSLFFGRGLQSAARAVAKAGNHAIRVMGRARDGVAEQGSGRAGGVRVSPTDSRRPRVAFEEAETSLEPTPTDEATRQARNERA